MAFWPREVPSRPVWAPDVCGHMSFGLEVTPTDAQELLLVALQGQGWVLRVQNKCTESSLQPQTVCVCLGVIPNLMPSLRDHVVPGSNPGRPASLTPFDCWLLPVKLRPRARPRAKGCVFCVSRSSLVLRLPPPHSHPELGHGFGEEAAISLTSLGTSALVLSTPQC